MSPRLATDAPSAAVMKSGITGTSISLETSVRNDVAPSATTLGWTPAIVLAPGPAPVPVSDPPVAGGGGSPAGGRGASRALIPPPRRRSPRARLLDLLQLQRAQAVERLLRQVAVRDHED